MKKFLAILLAVTILSCNFHIDEMAKLPALLRHFTEHQTNQNLISWLGFLEQHYSKNLNSESQSSNRSHSKLPFKSDKNMTSHIGIFTVDSINLFKLFRFQIILPFHGIGITYIEGFLSIWQPPKIGSFF